MLVIPQATTSPGFRLTPSGSGRMVWGGTFGDALARYGAFDNPRFTANSARGVLKLAVSNRFRCPRQVYDASGPWGPRHAWPQDSGVGALTWLKEAERAASECQLGPCASLGELVRLQLELTTMLTTEYRSCAGTEISPMRYNSFCHTRMADPYLAGFLRKCPCAARALLAR